MIQYIPDARLGSEGSEVPVVFGGNTAECEVYDTSEKTWTNYGYELPEVS